MIGLYVAAVVLWLITGTLVLTKNQVSKSDYSIIWIVLMIHLIGDLIIKIIEKSV